jgi:predicted RecA/RadA family phage recombinase
MKNFIQHGDTLTATAPAGGVSSGDGVLIENLFGVAATDADAGDEVELAVVGVYELPKVSTDTIVAFQRVYWDATEKKVTETDNTDSHYPIGVATEAAGNGATIVKVRLDGVGTVG